MERLKKKRKEKNNFDLNFENEELEQLSIKRIREDYFNTLYSRLFVIICVFLYIIITFYLLDITILYKWDFVPPLEYSILEPGDLIIDIFKFTFVWIIIGFLAYLLFYILKLIFYRNMKQFIKYLEKEILMLGFETKKLKVGLKSFIFINCIFYFIILLFNYQLYSLTNINLLYRSIFFILYIVIAVIIPVILGSYQNKIKILLKKKAYIKIKFKIKSSNNPDDLINKIYLYFQSNRLCLKYNKSKSDRYFKISEKKWLPRYDKFKFISKITPFHYFFEFSTPVNFQNKLLNLTLALREWEKIKKSE